MEIILGSASPRRKDIMESLNLNFKIVCAGVDESTDEPDPEKRVKELSLKKAMAVANSLETESLIIAADTVVYLEGEYYNKPKDIADAVRILTCLSGKTHKVYTGVTLIYKDTAESFCETSLVKMKSLTPAEIRAYIEKCRPLDKAGAYGIQDETVVEGYSGSYTNIVGLPVEKLKIRLKKWSIL